MLVVSDDIYLVPLSTEIDLNVQVGATSPKDRRILVHRSVDSSLVVHKVIVPAVVDSVVDRFRTVELTELRMVVPLSKLTAEPTFEIRRIIVQAMVQSSTILAEMLVSDF